LYYEYQRWYDPSVGRFVSEDPLAGDISDPSSLNAYIYVEDSPTSYTDPSGMGAVAVTTGNGCPQPWEGNFWKNPLGSIGCHFGIGGTVRGGGEGGGTGTGIGGPRIGISPNAAGAAVFLILWGIWGVNWLYTHWDSLSGDRGGGPTPPGDNNGNGGTKPGGPGGAVRVPRSDWSTSNLGSQFGTMGQSTLSGTRIAVDNPILDPYKPRNTSVPPPSTRARIACTVAILSGVGLGIYADVETSKLDLELPAEGALWAGSGCVGLLLMSHLWT
jgi:hypothetical protein